MVRKLLIALLSLTCVCSAAAGFAGCITPERPRDPSIDSPGNNEGNGPVYNNPDAEVKNDLQFELNEDKNGYIFTGINADKITTIQIPDEYKPANLDVDPLPVTEIAQNALATAKGKALTTITIGKNVKKIGDAAFSGCSNLRSIILPDGVTDIGINCFLGCSSMVILELGSSLRTISNNMVADCVSLEEINIPDTVTRIGSYAFARCTSLSTVTFGGQNTNRNSRCEAINNGAFSGCTALESVTLTGRNLITLGEEVFMNCTGLKTVSLGGGALGSIGFACFSGCSSLQKITLPFVGRTKYNSVQEYQTALSNGDTTENVGDTAARNTLNFGYIFGNTNTDANNPGNVGCKIPASLTDVVITGGTVIPESAFESCSNIKYLEIGEGIQRLCKLCMALTSFDTLVISSTVNKIEHDILLYSSIYGSTEATIKTKLYYYGTQTQWNPVFAGRDPTEKDVVDSEELKVLNDRSIYYYSDLPEPGRWHFGTDGKPQLYA